MLQLAIVARVAAEPRPCVDTLAAAQYGGELKHIPNHIAIGVFAKTFGDAFPVVKKELDRGREFIRVQLVWKDNHQFGKAELKAAIKEAKRYQILCNAYPGRIEISPFTEHNISKPDSYLDKVQAAAPSCRIVNNPWPQGGGGFSKRYKSEIHNTHSNVPGVPFNFSFDGENSVDYSPFEKALTKFKDAELFCIWHPRLNLRWRMKDSASRAQRIKEAKQRSPNRQMLESLVYLFTDPGPIHTQPHVLLKSHADNHGPNPITGQPDTKGDKLLIIAPIREPQGDGYKPIVLKRDGMNIGQLGYYGTFNDENTGKILGYRYYGSKFGYEYGPRIIPWIGKKSFGIMNGGFRAGKL